MILFDTNVIIDMINNEDDFHWTLLNQENCVVCGIVISELYSGIKNKKELSAIRLFINSVDSLPLEESDWKSLGEFICKLKKNGLSVPYQDAVIAYLSLKYNCKIATKDNHFKLMQKIERKINLTH